MYMPFKYGKIKKGVLQALTGVKQETIDTWFKQWDEQILKMKQEKEHEQQIRKQLLPKLLELHNQGMTSREIAKVTGISHATIARYIKLAKAEAQSNAKT